MAQPGIDDDINEFRELLAACDDEFGRACRFGDIARVREMLLVQCPSAGRVPPLCYAARNAHFGVVRALIAARAAVNAQCFDSPAPSGPPSGPLRSTGSTGRVGRTARTPLFYACADPGIESALTSSGNEVSVNARSLDELRRRQLGVVKLLLEARADANLGQSAVSLAVRNRNAEVARELLRASADPNGRDERNTPALIDAAFNADIECVRLLLASKADVHLLDTSVRVGATNALIAATASVTERPVRESIAVIDALVDANADPNAHPWIVTPLAMAARMGSNRVLCALLSRGARVNAKGDGENTALHLACAAAHEATRAECVVSLLAHRADANVGGNETPLFLGARSGSTVVVGALLDHGALVDATSVLVSGAPVTPLFISVESNHLDVAKLLLTKGASVESTGELGTPLALACYLGNVAFVRLLLDARSNVNDESAAHGERPLALAARSGSVDAVLLLLAARADVNAAGHATGRDGRVTCGSTALERAVAAKHAECVRVLIKHGAKERAPFAVSGAEDAAGAAGAATAENAATAAKVQAVLARYRCFFCRKLCATKQCRGCRMVSFCDAECERRGNAAHRSACLARAVEIHEAEFKRVCDERGATHASAHEALVKLVKALSARAVGRYDDALAVLKKHFEPLSEMSRTLPRLVCVSLMFGILRRSGRGVHAELAYEMAVEMRDARRELVDAQRASAGASAGPTGSADPAPLGSAPLARETEWACREIAEQIRFLASGLEPEMRVALLRGEVKLGLHLGLASARTVYALARALRKRDAQSRECREGRQGTESREGRTDRTDHTDHTDQADHTAEARKLLLCAAELAVAQHGETHRVTRRIERAYAELVFAAQERE
jgi:ankyrin repeat protein